MRDGEYLAADVHSPDTTQDFPVILVKTPYNKAWYRTHGLPLETGDYAFVMVDWRGFYGSAGAVTDSMNHGEDGYDCVEWIAARDWCNGRIGMWGISAVGSIQYQTAQYHPPHLVCGVPVDSDYMIYYQRYFCGGAYRKEYVEIMGALGYSVEHILKHPRHDLFWTYVELVTDYPQKIDVPMLLIAGWYDHHSYTYGMFRTFHDLRTQGGANAREHHKLIIGPWHHNCMGDTVQGELEYPDPAGVFELEALDFLDYWLRDIPNSYDTLPPVRYYQMGEDDWSSAQAWPPEGVDSMHLYLHPAGSLSVVMPTDTFPPDSFCYDPRDPSPTIGGAAINPFIPGGPRDQRWLVENRDDAILFSTSVLDEDLAVSGEVRVQLYVSSDRLDTDFTVRFCDVYPDGRSMLVMEGVRRMRFRESFEEEVLMTPGEIYPVTIELPHTALTFLAGHRVRLCISSSNYPRFDINLNNGDSLYVQGDTLIASNYIYHDVRYPSVLILPVSDSAGVEEESNYQLAMSDWQLSIHPNPSTQVSGVRFQVLGTNSSHPRPPPAPLPAPSAHSGGQAGDEGGRAGMTLAIHDLSGRLVCSLNLCNLGKSVKSVVWDGTDNSGKRVSTGVYFCKLEIGNAKTLKKLVLLR